MKILKFLSLLIIVSIATACSNSPKSDGVDYFSKSGIEIPKYSNVEVNNHLNDFKNLWNVLSTAVKNDDKSYSPELSIQFSDWTIKALKMEDRLKAEERTNYYAFVEELAKKWDGEKDKLD
ncbi:MULTISPECIES: hypothetical protein [Pedobacter]|uniref:hypothetical protein n=1 Tax=Pedobacter TaxID=84567 RepID=UPI001E4D93EA|nr:MULTISPECIES: hypothetical protein [Pedobacter]